MSEFPRTDSVVLQTEMVQLWCVFGYFGFGKLKEESSIGHCDDESKITEKKLFVSVRAPEEITIRYVKCIRRVAKITTNSFVVSETARFQAGRLL